VSLSASVAPDCPTEEAYFGTMGFAALLCFARAALSAAIRTCLYSE
jgi:hypothetical protein